MDVSGERRLSEPRSTVWEALHDAETLRAAIPGCERLEETGPGAYDLTVRVGIAAVRGTYTGTVRMTEDQPPTSYRLFARGQGRAGSAEGDALITLSENHGGTLLRYEATVRAQGAIARMGNRIIGGAARMMADRFFEAFERQMQERAA